MAGDPSNLPPKKPASPKVFNCSNCGAGIPLRALGLTVTVACASCGSVIDVTNESYRIIATVEKKKTLKPLIPLGTRGKLEGITWEIIGFMQRTDASGDYPWREYLLFNPYHGFRWLTESDGHWNVVRMTKSKPSSIIANTATFQTASYRLFHRGRAKVAYVIGEFYWRVKVGEIVSVEDFVAPPRMLSAEKSSQEIVWSVAEYIEPEAVKEAFGIKRAMPLRAGVAPNQCSVYRDVRPRILMLAGIFFAIVCALQLFSLFTAQNQEVYAGNYVYRAGDPERTKVTPPFQISGRLSNVAIRLDSPVENSWLSLEGELVNDRTGQVTEFAEDVEFYSGYDSDGYWSEGSRSTRKIVAPVPSGTYHLNFEVTGPPEMREQPYTLSVQRGVPRWPNFFWALILLSLLPVYVWWRDRSFELSRWSTSDYSPYQSSSDDD